MFQKSNTGVCLVGAVNNVIKKEKKIYVKI